MEKMGVNNNMFNGCYKDKKVLVTGHTGFKGSWLSLWLDKLGAEVVGFSKYLPTDPCHFDTIDLKSKIKDNKGDVRNIAELKKVFDDFKPEIVFHLAAQPIVRKSYNDPKLTFDTNLGGTVNVLECIRNSSSVKAGVIITSDKCYENIEQHEGYHEKDRLGGKDPYSASKACAEIAFSAYARSFFSKEDEVRVATTRAGNVIGGGDWAVDRIVPDCIKAWSEHKIAEIRSPNATRPWQHVLEPLSGYLWLGACLLSKKKNISGEAFNFGPDSNEVRSVKELADMLVDNWEGAKWEQVALDTVKKEAMLLRLSCEKVKEKLSWFPVLNFEQTIKMTADWYKTYYADKSKAYEVSNGQIDEYIKKAVEKDAVWARG